MFSKLIRDFKISRNHRRRVNSIVLRSNEEIVRTLDSSRSSFLEADRLGRKEDAIRFKAMKDLLEWLTNVTE